MNQYVFIHPGLAHYIKRIEIIDIEQSTAPYKVYPGLFVVMGFQYQGNISLLTDENKKINLKQSGITGLLTNYRKFKANSSSTKTILIHFYPWAIPVFFKESANVFTDQSLGLSDVLEEQIIKNIEEKIQSTQDPTVIVNHIQEFLIQLSLANNPNYLPQQRIIHIVKEIILNPSKESILELARNYGYSQRSLERYFQSIIGLSPKKFMVIARFHKALQRVQRGGGWTMIPEDSSYYDQSHFIKEFQQFTGVTPQKFLNKNQ